MSWSKPSKMTRSTWPSLTSKSSDAILLSSRWAYLSVFYLKGLLVGNYWSTEAVSLSSSACRSIITVSSILGILGISTSSSPIFYCFERAALKTMNKFFIIWGGSIASKPRKWRSHQLCGNANSKCFLAKNFCYISASITVSFSSVKFQIGYRFLRGWYMPRNKFITLCL